MADANFSAVPRSTHAFPHPMANPGYGKRSAPGQRPRASDDFAHLPPREAAIAAYVDRLPDGADISVKTLAKELPYGQCALRTALNNLTRAGHLRRGREHLAGSGSSRWVTRSWFTRTARDDGWWALFSRGGIPEEPPDRRSAPTRSRAHILLAALGRTTPALSLSARDCADLAPLLAEWFTRGATDEQVVRALTAGLPVPVHSPAALVRTRLRDKLPPEPAPEPVGEAPSPPDRMLECAECRAPGSPEALPGGFCGRCSGKAVPSGTAPLTSTTVRAHAAEIRAAMAHRRERAPV
ncbi:hypothetical protein [Streptomyces sp. NPDC002580]|uniref:hypothetical protein n=1 Tax=Streptomyces sp. NPDC002580 TaxID=3364653 RepID=UPI00367FBCD7